MHAVRTHLIRADRRASPARDRIFVTLRRDVGRRGTVRRRGTARWCPPETSSFSRIRTRQNAVFRSVSVVVEYNIAVFGTRAATLIINAAVNLDRAAPPRVYTPGASARAGNKPIPPADPLLRASRREGGRTTRPR